MAFLFDKKVVVKRYSSTLGEYNRPTEGLSIIGTYECRVAESNSNTAQKQPQKQNTTSLNLYADPETPIERGDILYIYEVDEYEEIVKSTELKAIADKPYKKRTILRVPLVSDEEV